MCLCEVCYISSVGSCMYELVVCFMNKMLSSSFNIKNCRLLKLGQLILFVKMWKKRNVNNCNVVSNVANRDGKMIYGQFCEENIGILAYHSNKRRE